MSKLKIAIQKSGRLSQKSLELLQKCGIKITNDERTLKTSADNFPIEVLFLRDDDIPQYVEQGVADIGILGSNVVNEKDKKVQTIRELGFGNCRLSLAIPKDETYTGIEYFDGKKIATSYQRILKKYFDSKQIKVEIEEISGSVEIATSIGLADGVFDIVSSGSTLMMNGLKEVEVISKSEAVMIANDNISDENQIILDNLLVRIDAVRKASQNKYILLNIPDDKIEEVGKLLPGMKSPTVLPLATTGWSSIHSVVKEDDFWEITDRLKQLGAQGILVVPIEKMIE